jgi:uncharacterized spore protein YtfJ
MSEKGYQKFVAQTIESQEEAIELMERLFDAAAPEAVYSEPVFAGEYTVITACEVSVGLGFGYGLGAGGGPTAPQGEEEDDEEQKAEAGFGVGGGGGGGGGAAARPVAVISVGPNGVSVEPIIDVSKLAIAFFTTLGSMFMMMSKMRQASRKHG